MKRIGERIRRKRDVLNMQLNELALKVGISASALSQIEKAKAFPSIFTLKAIAESLNTTVGELIGENESLSKNPVVRKNEMKFVEITPTGTEVFLLSHHDVNKQMDTYFVRFTKKSNLNNYFESHSGQVFCYVVAGSVNFELDDKEFVLSAGDTIYFNNKTPYFIQNVADSHCEMLWVINNSVG
ncbi:MAG TPA: XRE family transcriptional regulator [Prolixibacteraceae bacterium]|nr:XRE family transcriptional regulator [Prolixibacteraceae bacterium]HPR61944.1 XRE family transcriptional regulator [Prolixibacteraceae bacterium]